MTGTNDGYFEQRLVVGPREFPELFQAFAEGCSDLVRNGITEQQPWHVDVVDDDGSKRELNAVELAALAAQFEQAFGGRPVLFGPVEESPSS